MQNQRPAFLLAVTALLIALLGIAYHLVDPGGPVEKKNPAGKGESGSPDPEEPPARPREQGEGPGDRLRRGEHGADRRIVCLALSARSGEPLAGAQVVFDGRSVTTGEDGLAAYTFSAGRTTVRVAFSRPGYTAYGSPRLLSVTDRHVVLPFLARDPTISGIVRDEEGDPLGDAQIDLVSLPPLAKGGTIRLDSHDPVGPFRTVPLGRADARGNFSLPLPGDIPLHSVLIATQGTNRPAFHRFGAGGSSPRVPQLQGLVLQPRQGTECTIRCLDREGTPVAGLALQVVEVETRLWPGWTILNRSWSWRPAFRKTGFHAQVVTTDEEGVALLRNWVAGIRSCLIVHRWPETIRNRFRMELTDSSSGRVRHGSMLEYQFAAGRELLLTFSRERIETITIAGTWQVKDHLEARKHLKWKLRFLPDGGMTLRPSHFTTTRHAFTFAATLSPNLARGLAKSRFHITLVVAGREIARWGPYRYSSGFTLTDLSLLSASAAIDRALGNPEKEP